MRNLAPFRWGVLAALVAICVVGPSVRAQGEPPPAAAACVGDSASAAGIRPANEGLTAFARPDVKAIAEKITCYCGCPHLQVSKCFCGTADSIRELVATQIDEGMSSDAIIASYVAEHGTWVMEEPPKRGFNWIIWLGPVFLILFGTAALYLVGRHWVARRPAPSQAPLDSALDARLREQLERALERER